MYKLFSHFNPFRDKINPFTKYLNERNKSEITIKNYLKEIKNYVLNFSIKYFLFQYSGVTVAFRD